MTVARVGNQWMFSLVTALLVTVGTLQDIVTDHDLGWWELGVFLALGLGLVVAAVLARPRPFKLVPVPGFRERARSEAVASIRRGEPVSPEPLREYAQRVLLREAWSFSVQGGLWSLIAWLMALDAHDAQRRNMVVLGVVFAVLAGALTVVGLTASARALRTLSHANAAVRTDSLAAGPDSASRSASSSSASAD